MRGFKSWIALAALLIIATALVAAALPERAEAATLRGKLRAAKHSLRESRQRLARAQAALAAALVAEPVAAVTTGETADPVAAVTTGETADPVTPSPAPTVAPPLEELRARVAAKRRAVKRWKLRVQRLAKQYRRQQRIAEWERRGNWLPIIKIAAAKYHVNAAGIHRMMMRESGGQRYAGSNTAFKGLFQYWTGTWSASWNPWRRDSIYDGSSQIYATCYAVSRGMGPQMWTTTFASQY